VTFRAFALIMVPSAVFGHPWSAGIPANFWTLAGRDASGPGNVLALPITLQIPLPAFHNMAYMFARGRPQPYGMPVGRFPWRNPSRAVKQCLGPFGNL